ncbi:uncharacterized protein E5676_scaffold171G00030 [Cucumis melo var. makuwa]|uniref:Gag protease polyprotein n=1 Tax=Cucumis melo var. makuwa TaxID=1194695 RepID=A0A5D3BNL0_CUCMM|nr:uncharacterized protein E5676_scaffold171G00030 [Cucumis melo var. makuwa]
MSQYRGACRGGRRGRGAGRTQPEEQPAVQAANSVATITQVDLAAMENRYHDMLRDALALLHIARQTPQHVGIIRIFRIRKSMRIHAREV